MPFDVENAEPGHVEKARRAIHTLHFAHDNAATSLDRVVDRTTAILGKPGAILCVAVVIAAWIGANVAAGKHAVDPFPFPDLEFVVSAVALGIALLILASQRRADILADAREKMTLELSLQSAQKTSKIIELLEELRRDSPNVPDRVDAEATDMSARRDETELLEEGAVTPPATKT